MLSHYPSPAPFPSAPSSSSASSSSPRSRLSQLSTSSLSSLSSFDPLPTAIAPKTAAFFFSSPSISRPPSPPSASSKNTDFFFTSTPNFDDWPTPPQSIHSPSASGSASPSPRSSPPRLLARLFPSRYTSVRDHPHHQTPPQPSIPDPFPPAPPVPAPPPALTPGTTLSDPTPSSPIRLALVRTLGQGAFSSVWLASDLSGTLSAKRHARRTAAAQPDTALDGTRPLVQKALERAGSLGSARSVHLDERDGDSACADDGYGAAAAGGFGVGNKPGRLVAVKATPRADDHTRVSFVREVEVLRHISHPAIVAHLASFTTTTHHVLVLEHLSGGELFDLVNSDAAHARLSEHTVRRMWGDLSKAVAWMHGVGLVHRDIKLENILLTTHPSLPPPPAPLPLLKLSDFGLARFVDPAAPLLATRCGSESYAAPELVTPGRQYDGRATDAWACGVVLYALATRRLPFGEVVREGTGDGDGARRSWLMRIARGEYEWPVSAAAGGAERVLFGAELAASRGVRRVVGRLLVRDPERRARVRDVLGEWETGESEGGGERVEEEYDEDGRIVDREGIASIASEEVQ